jgi:surface polysaccharide O-acyltransferase-like enzyme
LTLLKKHIFFFDLLRTVAAIAVIVIHALGPFKHEFGQIPFFDWATAITFNSFSRWAVPVFILISGALLLSDKRPFDMKYYLSRRVSKVVVPFLVWSLFYAYLSGWTSQGFDLETTQMVLSESYHHQTYYHLGFFYYFIPLYIAVPFLQAMVRKGDDTVLYAFTAIWLITTTLFLFRINGIWNEQFWLFLGYLPLGYLLYQKLPLSAKSVSISLLLGGAAMILTAYMVVTNSIEAGKYTYGRWLSYKTINTVLAACLVFVVCRASANHLPESLKTMVRFVGKHSLGVYLLHPLFLWPMIEFKLHQGPALIMIPIWVTLSGAGSLTLTWWISKSPKFRWLLP